MSLQEVWPPLMVLSFSTINDRSFRIPAGAVVILVVFVRDKTQTKEPIRRRYPVLVWGRKSLVGLGPLLRQYLFMGDQEEMPYNRITRKHISARKLEAHSGASSAVVTTPCP